MTRLYLLEPEDATGAWAPFAGVRPIAELRAGAWLIRERWEAAFGLQATAILSAPLAGFSDTAHPPVIAPGEATGPAWVVRADVVPSRLPLVPADQARCLTLDGEPVAWRLDAGQQWQGAITSGPDHPISGMHLRGSWGLVTALEQVLGSDAEEFTRAGGDPIPDGVIVLGDPSRVVLLDAEVEPGTVFDTRQGAVVLTEGVVVRSGTRLEGPLVAGPGTLLLGGHIRHASFGPQCRVHGEVSTSVFVGFANKSHDGFVGHSVLGHWVNLGAGTITSNLKNTYGEVRLDGPGGRHATGRTQLGSLIADHAKTAIGTLLGTGTLIGAAASVVGTAGVPKHVPPFAWGLEGEQLTEEGFLRIAERVLPRRGIALTADRIASLRALHRRHAT